MSPFDRDALCVWRTTRAAGTGSFTSASIAWDEAWTMDEFVKPLFNAPACVVFGRRWGTARPLPDKVRAYSAGEVLDSEAAANRGFEGLHGWMSNAENHWNAHRASDIN